MTYGTGVKVVQIKTGALGRKRKNNDVVLKQKYRA